MIILIPMGGAGSRFKEAGYKEDKAEIQVTDRNTGLKIPMIIASMQDLLAIENKKNTIVCIDRKKHAENGLEDIILSSFSNTHFIHDTVLLDQAYACFLAKEYLMSDDELLIGNCDSGFALDNDMFQRAKENSDAIIFTQHNSQTIEDDPDAHSWIISRANNVVSDLSIKKAISSNPKNDHATTGIFWFKKASIFLKILNEMIDAKDMLDNKYYVDKTIPYYLKDKLDVQFLDVEYFCWGTPKDFENYEKTFQYWLDFHCK